VSLPALAVALVLALLTACTPKSSPIVDAAPEASAGYVQDAAIDAKPADASIALPGARPSPGCAAGPTLAAGFVKDAAIEVAGKKRTYAALVPKSVSSGGPLRIVFGFHGDVRTGMDVREALMLEDQADGEAIFVYPDGLEKTWKTEDASEKNADYVFFDVLLEHFGRTACIDLARVFLTGFSRGAFFANQLGCRRDVRAVAPVAGGGPYVLPGDPPLKKGGLECPFHPAAMLFHGDADTNVPIGSGRASRDFWVRSNGCSTTTSPFDPSPCVASDACADGRPVIWCSLPKHTHRVWKEAPAAIWKFFRGF